MSGLAGGLRAITAALPSVATLLLPAGVPRIDPHTWNMLLWAAGMGSPLFIWCCSYLGLSHSTLCALGDSWLHCNRQRELKDKQEVVTHV